MLKKNINKYIYMRDKWIEWEELKGIQSHQSQNTHTHTRRRRIKSIKKCIQEESATITHHILYWSHFISLLDSDFHVLFFGFAVRFSSYHLMDSMLNPVHQSVLYRIRTRILPFYLLDVYIHHFVDQGFVLSFHGLY